MEYNPGQNPIKFNNALFPPSKRDESDDFKDFQSYIYVISKRFPPYNDHDKPSMNKELNLVKIGFTSLKGRYSKRDNVHGRLLGFRTSLISFKVHRFYIYKKNKLNEGIISAFQAELNLHEIVTNLFKPKAYRMKFKTETESEWFSEGFRGERLKIIAESLPKNPAVIFFWKFSDVNLVSL